MRRVHILFIVASWTSAHVQVGACGVLFLVVFFIFPLVGKGTLCCTDIIGSAAELHCSGVTLQ